MCRVLLGAVFVFSGFVKAVDPIGVGYKIQDYLSAFGLGSLLPSFMPLVLGMLLSAVEFCLGIYMLLGIRRRLTTSLILLLLAFMTPLTLYLALANPVSDCGCFGDAVFLTNWQTFWKNVVLLAAAVTAFVWRRYLSSLVTAEMSWMLSLYSFLFIFVLMSYCLATLPILDFRPYRAGSDIKAGMAMPEGAKPSVYRSVFTLEKDGVQKEFTLGDYPDSTWTFVKTENILVEKGYEPPIKDFFVQDLETGEDVTDVILGDTSYVFLLVMHRVEEADDSNIDLVNELYDYSVEQGWRFYAVTSSTREAIDAWRDATGAEYPFGLMDDIVLKTMIRSNPGLMLLKDGTVMNKWSNRQLPDEYVLADSIEEWGVASAGCTSDGRTLLYVGLWFVIPLMLIVGADRIVKKRRQKTESINLNKR